MWLLNMARKQRQIPENYPGELPAEEAHDHGLQSSTDFRGSDADAKQLLCGKLHGG